jgi:hypothetical protein
MVPMHLGLIDGPFVFHDLMSAQESPVPLPKFQVDPRLKILMYLVPRKEPRYIFLFSQKVLTSKSPLSFQMGPIYREIPASRLFLHIC